MWPWASYHPSPLQHSLSSFVKNSGGILAQFRDDVCESLTGQALLWPKPGQGLMESSLYSWPTALPNTHRQTDTYSPHTYTPPITHTYIHYVCVCEVAQSCPTLWDPMGCSPSSSSVHGILQARILEWVAISFSRGSSPPRDRTQVSCIAGRRFNLGATREALIGV